jgi:hypothetical protein
MGFAVALEVMTMAIGKIRQVTRMPLAMILPGHFRGTGPDPDRTFRQQIRIRTISQAKAKGTTKTTKMVAQLLLAV